MNEEEKKAIELLEDIKNNSWTTKYIMSSDSKNAELLLNLIEKLQKENEELKDFKKQVTYIENTNFIKYKNYIPKSKLKDIIDRIDYDIKKTKEIISKNTNIYASYRKNDYQIVRLRAMNTKSLDIKKRLQKLLESEK